MDKLLKNRIALLLRTFLLLCAVVSGVQSISAAEVELRAKREPARLMLDQPVDQARSAVLAGLQHLPSTDEQRRYRLVLIFGMPLFLSDADIAVDATPRGSLGELTGWLNLPAASRMQDLLVTPDIDYFWPADYYLGRQRIGFTTSFILHFGRGKQGGTVIDILQINGFVRLGKRFDLLGRTGPKYYWDDRPAAPSPQAARDLQAVLGRISGQHP